MKPCTKCNETKPLSEFYKNVSLRDGHSNTCKACKNLKTEQWRIDNREKYNSEMRKYNKRNYHKIRLQRYDLVPDQHLQMLADQNGKCAICKKSPKTLRPLNVDHDHATGKTRGLLCHGCNRLMVLLDNPELLKSATEYNAKHS